MGAKCLVANSKFGFCSKKTRPFNRSGALWPIYRGTVAHLHNVCGRLLFRVTRTIVDFRRHFGIFWRRSGPRYSCQNFFPDGPWASPYSALEKLAPTHTVFEKFAETFLGVAPPQGGAWGQNLRGRPRICRGAH